MCTVITVEAAAIIVEVCRSLLAMTQVASRTQVPQLQHLCITSLLLFPSIFTHLNILASCCPWFYLSRFLSSKSSLMIRVII